MIDLKAEQAVAASDEVLRLLGRLVDEPRLGMAVLAISAGRVAARHGLRLEKAEALAREVFRRMGGDR